MAVFKTWLVLPLAVLLWPGGEVTAAAKLKVTSSAFGEGQRIPKKYTADGKDTSPPLHWSGVPRGTKNIAIICDDPDAPGKVWVHWVLFNLPARTRELSGGVAKRRTVLHGARQGTNDMRKIGYNGPAPPRGKPHHYHFKVYALDKKLRLRAGATKQELVAVMKGHILAEGELVGLHAGDES
jgi:Raf kinase inhibitor-like YbhB/YbcL family protein